MMQRFLKGSMLFAMAFAQFPDQAGAQCVQGLLPSDYMTENHFGYSVDIDGDSAVVGSIWGPAYILERSAGLWVETHKFDPADSMGSGVAIHGDWMLGGAPYEQFTGQVFVYNRSGGLWSQATVLSPSGVADGARFGESVAYDGMRAIIGASGEGEAGTLGGGAAHIYLRSGSTWTEEARLTVPGLADQANWANTVDIAGDRALIGRSWGVGRAYIFKRTGSVWALEAEITGSDTLNQDNFGEAVAFDGDVAVIGARFANAGAYRTGAAYVFERSGSTWSETAKLVAADRQTKDAFGTAVAIDGDRIIIGAEEETTITADPGHAYAFRRVGSNWEQVAAFAAPDGQGFDKFGTSLAIDGDTVLVGAYNHDWTDTESGMAYFYDLFAGPDCNGNGISDHCDIATGGSPDFNSNSIPDECECVVANYCTTSPNSVGPGARISNQGSASLAANNLRLVCDGCPSSQFGIFFYGPDQDSVPFGDGMRCVGGGINRFNPVVWTGSGVATYQVNYSLPPASSGPGEITPMSTYHFQFWYRDPAAGGSGFNLSDGLQVSFCY